MRDCRFLKRRTKLLRPDSFITISLIITCLFHFYIIRKTFINIFLFIEIDYVYLISKHSKCYTDFVITVVVEMFTSGKEMLEQILPVSTIMCIFENVFLSIFMNVEHPLS